MKYIEITSFDIDFIKTLDLSDLKIYFVDKMLRVDTFSTILLILKDKKIKIIGGDIWYKNEKENFKPDYGFWSIKSYSDSFDESYEVAKKYISEFPNLDKKFISITL